MNEITYTLLSDGTSDKALLPIIDWIIQAHFPTMNVQRQWADLSRLPQSTSVHSLAGRMSKTLSLYDCDWLFVHRDAEKELAIDRIKEINEAWRSVTDRAKTKQLISIVPVRMTEAWLLFDEQAIRKAASNPSGRDLLKLPPLLTVDSIPDPKQQLKELLRQASGLSGRRLQKFNESKAIQLVADYIPDFSPLRKLAAFVDFEKSVQSLIVG